MMHIMAMLATTASRITNSTAATIPTISPMLVALLVLVGGGSVTVGELVGTEEDVEAGGFTDRGCLWNKHKDR